MLHKGLWFQHYKQSKYMLWAFWAVAFLSGFELYNHAGNTAANLQYSLKEGRAFEYYFGMEFEVISILQLLLCIGLPAFLIGFRRTNQSLEYTYALPVKRAHIYLSKWLLGLVHIIGATTFGLILQLTVLHTTLLNNYIPDSLFWMYYLHQLAILCAVFSFSLWVGLIGGSFLSQGVFSFLFLLLPYVLFGLLKTAVSLHFFAFGITDLGNGWLTSQAIDRFFENLSFPIKLLNIDQLFSMETNKRYMQGAPQDYLDHLRQSYYGFMPFLVPLLVTAGSIWGMLRMAAASRNENNGKLLLHNRLRPYLTAGVMVCAFLFGGTFLEGMLGSHYYGTEEQHQGQSVANLLIFYIAAVGSTVAAYLLISKLLGKKLLFRKG